MGEESTDSEDIYVLWKFFLGLSIALSSCIGVFFPKVLLKWCANSAEKIMSLSNAFAGGVVLGVALVHLLPEAMDDFEVEHPNVNAPIILYSCTFGFMLLILVENIVLGQKQRIETRCVKDGNIQDELESECICHNQATEIAHTQPTDVPSYGTDNIGDSVSGEEATGEGTGKAMEEDTQLVDEFTSYTLMCALCFHSVIEGFALGMLTDLPDLILVYIAIISHKAVAAFALGTSMLKAELPSFRYGVLACIFIFATPLGMLIAVIVLEFLASSEGSTATVTLVTEGIAAGTFLFVATMEIFAEEFHCQDPLFYPKFFLALAGVAFMALVSIYS